MAFLAAAVVLAVTPGPHGLGWPQRGASGLPRHGAAACLALNPLSEGAVVLAAHRLGRCLAVARRDG